jgi:plasmid stabilization system protein ParE
VCPVRFTEAARAELIDAQDCYETEALGLGRRFRAEIDSVVQLMADNPDKFPWSTGSSCQNDCGGILAKDPLALE